MTVYIIDIEAVDTRYTAQWKKHLPQQLRKRTDDVVVISGGETPQATTPGAFLNFGGTNVYKSKQLEQIGECSVKGKLRLATIFCIPMPGILQLYNYATWQSYWVLAFALVASGMLVVMTHKISWED